MTWKLTPELEQKICDLLVAGYSIRKICRMNGMPDRNTLMKLERENPEFSANIGRAREAKLEDDAEELEEINEQVKQGLIPAAEANVISNNIKWTASRLLPKYRDKQVISGDKDEPLGLITVLAQITNKSDELPQIE
jgi:hypothetical protein